MTKHSTLTLDHGPAVAARPRARVAPGVVTLEVQWNVEEITRREKSRIAPVQERSILHELLALPLGERTLTGTLRAATVRNLRQAPPGCIESGRGWLMRVIDEPCQVTKVTVAGEMWKPCFAEISPYANHCEGRGVILGADSPDWEMAAFEADWYGLGLASSDAPGQWVVAPRQVERVRSTAASWALAERIFGYASDNGLLPA